MKTREMIEYLQRFNPESDIYFLAVQIELKVKFRVVDIGCTDGVGRPAIGLRVGMPIGLDEEEMKAADLNGEGEQ